MCPAHNWPRHGAREAMKSNRRNFVWGLVLVLGLGVGAVSYKALRRPDPGPADKPVARVDYAKTWLEEYRQATGGAAFPADPRIMFLGDSLQRNWLDTGKAVWREYWEGRGAAVLAVGGDTTGHVLWRIEQGQMPPEIKPRVVVVQIGTNNISKGQEGAELAAGVGAVVKAVRAKLPEARVLVMGIFPRHPTPHRIREKVKRTNAALAAKAAEWGVTFVDIGGQFLDAQGNLPKETSPDALHLSEQGYRVWAKAVVEQVDRLAAESAAGAAQAPLPLAR